MISNGDSIGRCNGNGGGSASDSGDQMDNEQREREIARRKEEAKRKRRKKKRTGSSLVSSCFQGKNKNHFSSLDIQSMAMFDVLFVIQLQ